MEPKAAAEVYVWAWPLLASSAVVFVSGQANQMVIGGAFSVSRLAGYAIASSLVNIPWFVLASVGSSVLLPILARSVSSKERFEGQLLMYFGGSAVIGVLLFAGFAFCGEKTVVLLYGKVYTGCGIYVTILGAGVGVRLLGIVTTLAALAWGDTTNELFSNIWMCVTLPLSILSVYFGLGPVAVAACVAFGEFVGLIASFWRLRRIVIFPLKDAAFIMGYFIFFAALVLFVSAFGVGKAGALDQIGAAVVVCVLAMGVGKMLFPWFRDMSFAGGLPSKD